MKKRKPKYNKALNAAIMEVVENQLRDGDPIETLQTYNRLRREGFSDEQARNLIGTVVVSEIVHVLHENRPYDRERYVAALKRLPTVPWE